MGLLLNGTGVLDQTNTGFKVKSPTFPSSVGGTIVFEGELRCDLYEVIDRAAAYESSKLLCFFVTLS